MKGVHSAASAGFTAWVDAYVAGRPGYPPQIETWLRETLRLEPQSLAVEVGAGSGKFTALLAGTGARVIAVEPVAAMRERLARDLPEVDARDGYAEALPLASESADALVCAQAFHWFATSAAVVEMRRVLKPGGVLGLVWNVRDEAVPWVAALTRVIAPYEGDTPRFAGGEWRHVFPAPGFGPLVEHTFAHAHVGPASQVVVARLLSTSFIAALDADTRADIAAQARGVLTAHGVGETVAFPYVTRAYACERR